MDVRGEFGAGNGLSHGAAYLETRLPGLAILHTSFKKRQVMPGALLNDQTGLLNVLKVMMMMIKTRATKMLSSTLIVVTRIPPILADLILILF